MIGLPAFHVSFRGGISLSVGSVPADRYPSSRIPKGLTLACHGADFTEEGVGFGVPVLRTDLETIFPSNNRFFPDPENPARIVVAYDMGLVQRLSRAGKDMPGGRLLDLMNQIMARLHRGYPFLRPALAAASSPILRAFGLRETFRYARPRGLILCDYTLDAEREELRVIVDARRARTQGCVELIIMNELGARRFSSYRDSRDGSLDGRGIESWARVLADRAGFTDPASGVTFSVAQRAGARLFRGRELMEGRLSWAGFAYVLPPQTTRFEYSASITKVD